MRDKILGLLKKKTEYVSGEDLSGHLGISRQALWKHIQELRDAGYDIVAVPHLGYQLVSIPDRLLPAEVNRNLGTRLIGRKLYYFERVSSTMDIAMQLGGANAPEGTLVIAESQTKGRGRLGRGWISPKYKGIYVSLILKPDIPPADAPVLTLMAAVSICEGISQIAGIEPQIKWPNDIFVQNKKLGGILTELKAELDAASFVIIGIGLNVNNNSDELIKEAISLKEARMGGQGGQENLPSERSEDINRAELLKEILRRIEENYLSLQKKGSAPILEKWRNYNITLGRRVKAVSHKRHIEGEAVDIDTDGGLLLRTDSGIMEKLMAGDVVQVR
jgi:BirA family transcriptional regulator, biotin operon repressor / biotin---[acetyl-CoA-carboxylase] ligase